MKKSSLFLFFMVLISCTPEEDLTGVCQGEIDYIGSVSFVIELVDKDGNNLIENGFYSTDEIEATHVNSNTVIVDIVDSANRVLDKKNIIFLWSGIGKEGDNRYLLKLSKNDIDTLDFKLSYVEERLKMDGRLFCGTKGTLKKASYNMSNNLLEIIEPEQNNLIISIVKDTIQ